VLIVDSEPRSLIFTSMIIQRLAYHACSALGVGSALELADATAPSLVIAELHLKGLSGLDLLERLRQKPASASVPVIIMTREHTPAILEQCRGAGAAACLEKPVKVYELYQTIHALLEPGTRRREARIETRLSVVVNDRPLDCVDGECATNLSVSGMHLRTGRYYPEDSRVLLRLALNDETLEAEARVVHCRPPEDGCSGIWGVGLQFLKTSPEAGEIIRRFINDVVTHGMDPAREEEGAAPGAGG
jgi:DNA-binding response OmpR family regulator